jgi:uncharacterized protein
MQTDFGFIHDACEMCERLSLPQKHRPAEMGTLFIVHADTKGYWFDKSGDGQLSLRCVANRARNFQLLFSHSRGSDPFAFWAARIALALFPRANLVKDAQISADGQGFGGVSLAYNARSREEVDSVLAEAKAAGATLPKPAQNAFWGGYSGYFSDPDGFLWEIAWNPSFPIAEDGSIRLSD